MSNPIPILSALLLSLAISLAACAPREDQGAGASAVPSQDADMALETTVQQAWDADGSIPGFLLAAKLRDGKLQLFGTVESAAQRDAAVATAKRLAGDTPVVDQIEIGRIASLEGKPVGAGPTAVPSQDAAAALVATVEQAWIASGQIPYELLAAKERNGRLELFGTVETEEQHARAVKIAKEQAGAVPVVDHIAVR